MKIAACVILYEPEKSVDHNIISYINEVEKMYVVDNSEIKRIDLKFLSAYNANNIYINDGKNEGIAKRLNHVCNLAIEERFDFLLTMDQDSYFEAKALKNYLSCIALYPDKTKVAMFGINHQKKQNLKNGCVCKSVKHLITSGSIINLNLYKEIGIFDEDLFIDFVDTDYCFASILKGYQLIEFSNVFMHHEIGVTTQQRSLKTFKTTSRSIHSSMRLYYMMRNFLYLKKKYNNGFKEELLTFKKDLQNRIKNKLLYSKNRLQTIKNLIKAWKDFKQQKMGKQF